MYRNQEKRAINFLGETTSKRSERLLPAPPFPPPTKDRTKSCVTIAEIVRYRKSHISRTRERRSERRGAKGEDGIAGRLTPSVSFHELYSPLGGSFPYPAAKGFSY